MKSVSKISAQVRAQAALWQEELPLKALRAKAEEQTGMSFNDFKSWRDLVTSPVRDRAVYVELDAGRTYIKGKVAWSTFHCIELFALIIGDDLAKKVHNVEEEEEEKAARVEAHCAETASSPSDAARASTQSVEAVVPPPQSGEKRKEARKAKFRAKREDEYSKVFPEAFTRCESGSMASATDVDGKITFFASGFEAEVRGVGQIVDLEEWNGRPKLCSRYLKGKCTFDSACSNFHPVRAMIDREPWVPSLEDAVPAVRLVSAARAAAEDKGDTSERPRSDWKRLCADSRELRRLSYGEKRKGDNERAAAPKRVAEGSSRWPTARRSADKGSWAD